MNRRAAYVIAAYAVIAAVVIPVYPHFSSPNEFTRWALVSSLVERRTIEVSGALGLLGPRFEDLEVIHTRQYSNKAPGAALAALPGYVLARPVAGPPSRENLRLILTAMRLCGATLPLLVLAIVFAREAQKRGAESIAFALSTLLFATPLFAYGLLMFSHALVAACLFIAWALLYLRDDGGILAGALIGIAVLSEYPAAIPAAVLVLGVIRTKRVLQVIVGGIPFAILLAVYQKAAFGSFFASPLGHEKLPEYRELSQTALFGIHFPSPAIAFDLLLHPARGLLIFSPILIACFFARPAIPRAAFVTLIVTPLALFLLYAGYPNWHGGWNVGPRYIVATLPFIVFPLAFARVRWWTVVLFSASVIAVMLTTLTFPFPTLDFTVPWGSLGMLLVTDGLVVPNLGHLIAHPVGVAVPFVAMLVAIAVAIPRRFAIAAVAGVAIALAVGHMASRNTPRPYVERVYFEDVYFGQRGRLDDAVLARVASPSLLTRREQELPYGPTDWPF